MNIRKMAAVARKTQKNYSTKHIWKIEKISFDAAKVTIETGEHFYIMPYNETILKAVNADGDTIKSYIVGEEKYSDCKNFSDAYLLGIKKIVEIYNA